MAIRRITNPLHVPAQTKSLYQLITAHETKPCCETGKHYGFQDRFREHIRLFREQLASRDLTPFVMSRFKWLVTAAFMLGLSIGMAIVMGVVMYAFVLDHSSSADMLFLLFLCIAFGAAIVVQLICSILAFLG